MDDPLNWTLPLQNKAIFHSETIQSGDINIQLLDKQTSFQGFVKKSFEKTVIGKYSRESSCTHD